MLSRCLLSNVIRGASCKPSTLNPFFYIHCIFETQRLCKLLYNKPSSSMTASLRSTWFLSLQRNTSIVKNKPSIIFFLKIIHWLHQVSHYRMARVYSWQKNAIFVDYLIQIIFCKKTQYLHVFHKKITVYKSHHILSFTASIVEVRSSTYDYMELLGLWSPYWDSSRFDHVATRHVVIAVSKLQ